MFTVLGMAFGGFIGLMLDNNSSKGGEAVTVPDPLLEKTKKVKKSVDKDIEKD